MIWSTRAQEKAVAARLEAGRLSGRVNAQMHLFVVCVAQTHRMLDVLKQVGFKMSKDDRNFLSDYTKLRDTFEHLDDRLPGSTHEKGMELFKEVSSETEYSWEFGFDTDGAGRVNLNGTLIDVTSRGVESIQAILTRSWDPVREACLTNLTRYYQTHLIKIPNPRELNVQSISFVDSNWEPTEHT